MIVGSFLVERLREREPEDLGLVTLTTPEAWVSMKVGCWAWESGVAEVRGWKEDFGCSGGVGLGRSLMMKLFI